MYTRKQFFISAAKQCLDFVRTCATSFSENGPTRDTLPEKSDYESLYFEAMRLGIDPGTMNRRHLAETVQLAKEAR